MAVLNAPVTAAPRGPAATLLEFSRPFTLVAPALGFASGAATGIGAAPHEPWSSALIVYPLIGLTMAAVLNAASNALNQIYDLEIDRINKPKRPLPSGRLSRPGRRTGRRLGRAWEVCAPGGSSSPRRRLSPGGSSGRGPRWWRPG